MEPDSRIPEIGSAVGALTIEISPQAMGTGSAVPEPIGRDAALRLGEAIAGDLTAALGDVTEFGLVVPGALYDQTELLRPGFPIAEALEAVFRGTLRGQGYQPQLIALGLEPGEAFPVEALNPARGSDAGPLLVIPFAIVGPVEALSPFAERLEGVLLHEGVASATTRASVTELFGLKPVHMSYATLADLCALLSVQLEQNGFEQLWQLLEHGFLSRAGPIAVLCPEGNVFVADGREVWSPFYTVDAWSALRVDLATESEPADSYAAWTKVQRQFLLALGAYGYVPRLVVPAGETDPTDSRSSLEALRACVPLNGSWYCESPGVGRFGGTGSELVVTHHSHDELGTIAYTVETVDAEGAPLSTEHFYPLAPEGLESIVDTIEKRGESQGLPRRIVNPRCVLRDPMTGRLRGNQVPAPTRH